MFTTMLAIAGRKATLLSRTRNFEDVLSAGFTSVPFDCTHIAKHTETSVVRN